MNRKVKSIWIAQAGYNGNTLKLSSDERGTIETFNGFGEVAPVTSYRKDNLEVNGKYVIMVEYFK